MADKYTIDLHLHTMLSDGAKTPCEVVDSAAAAGLKKICLTDHDCLHMNYGRLREYARGKGVTVLPFSGVEVNTIYFEKEKPMLWVDVLVYGDDEAIRDPRITSMFSGFYGHTNVLAREHFENLAKVDIDMTYEELFLLDADIAPVYKNDMYCRSYVLKRAAEKIGVPHEQIRAMHPDLFPYNLPTRSVNLRRIADMPDSAEIVRTATELGLATVMAHPSCIDPFWEGDEHLATADRMETIIRDLAAEGLDGVEACHRELVDSGTTERVKGLARELGLLTTGGSDYHDDVERGCDLGVYGTTEAELAALESRIREKAAKVR